MKLIFWIGLIGLIAFEVFNVYFIMPMPGSQRMESIEMAYLFYKWRWIIRGLFAAIMLIGLFQARWHRRWKWLLILPLGVLAIVIYMSNFKMSADHMFYQPKNLLMAQANSNKVDLERLVIGVEQNGESKAYPIQFIGYHHQVQDSVGGKPVIVTYCTVCRTGRVYAPIVNGKHEQFRLVGMDHFNAMLEDNTTKSWWRQVTGEAVAGKLKGQQLPEIYSTQTSLRNWLELHPSSLIMQPDHQYTASYDTSFKYEAGKSRNPLTGTDSLSWKDKSWIIGVKAGKERKAYDWNYLMKERFIKDHIGNTPVMLVLASDNKSFYAFEQPGNNELISMERDTIYLNGARFRIDGKGIDVPLSLKPLPAYQEFWHSWRTFNPGTLRQE
jgi:hypothetical protein